MKGREEETREEMKGEEVRRRGGNKSIGEDESRGREDERGGGYDERKR